MHLHRKTVTSSVSGVDYGAERGHDPLKYVGAVTLYFGPLKVRVHLG